MPAYGKPNATGRSSGEFTSKEKEIFGPPRGKPWNWFPTELLASPAWRGTSINTRRLIDFLMIEHRNHAGLENGNLIATYNQLVDFGLTREAIRRAIIQAQKLGLIKVRDTGFKNPSRFTLTFYATPDFVAATNDWHRISEEDVKAIKEDQRQRRKSKRQWRQKNRIPVPKAALH